MWRVLTSPAPAVLVAAALVAAEGRPAARNDIVQPDTRTLFVSATDQKGAPVAGLQAGDFEVKLGGKRIEVVSAQPAQAPLRIALIVSDAGTGAFQQSIATFMQKLLGHAEFALVSVITQPEMIVDYSSLGAVLSAGVRRVGPRGRQRGAQLMEAILDATKHVRGDSGRRAIVVVRVGAEAATPLTGDRVREELRKSGATLYVVSTVGAQRAAPSNARPGISVEQAQLQDAEVSDSAFDLAQVLGDGSKESGGRHDQVISTTLVPALGRIADELLNQYLLGCAVPDGVKAGAKLSITSTRKGVRIHAPATLPG
jgi:VWFA-related protein